MIPLTIENAEGFGLLLIRCLSFFMAGPIFAQRTLPASAKLLLGAGTAVALFPLVPTPGVAGSTLPDFLLAVTGETFLGLLLGFAAALPFAGIRMAAGLIGIQMGFGIVSVFDPSEGTQEPLMARLYNLFAITLFLVLNGHHLLLRALGASLQAVPLGGVTLGTGVLGQLIGMGGSIFIMMLAVGAPLIAVLFLTDAAMGFVARAVPQMNIFIVGFPVKIGLGLLGVSLTLPFFSRTIDQLIVGLEHDLLTLLAGM